MVCCRNFEEGWYKERFSAIAFHVSKEYDHKMEDLGILLHFRGKELYPGPKKTQTYSSKLAKTFSNDSSS